MSGIESPPPFVFLPSCIFEALFDDAFVFLICLLVSYTPLGAVVFFKANAANLLTCRDSQAILEVLAFY